MKFDYSTFGSRVFVMLTSWLLVSYQIEDYNCATTSHPSFPNCLLNVVARLTPSYSCYYYVYMEECSIFVLSLPGAPLPKHRFFFSLIKFLWLTFLRTVISFLTILSLVLLRWCQMNQKLKWISQVETTIIYNFELCIPVSGGFLPLLFVYVYSLMKLWPEEAWIIRSVIK